MALLSTKRGVHSSLPMKWNEFSTHIRHLSCGNQKRVHQAFKLGEKMHGDQKRRSGKPYFTHPIAVACILSEMKADADALIAALLHDTVEDTTLTLEEIDEQFDGKVKSLIDGVTKLFKKDIKDNPTLDEKIETLRKMFTFMQKDVRILVIKLADRLHNMQTIEYFPREKQKAYAQDTLDIYVKIAEQLSMLDIQNELEGLCLAVLEPGLLFNLSVLRNERQKKSGAIIDRMHKKLESYDKNLKFEIQYIPKSWEKLHIQLESGETAVTGVSDLAIEVICEDKPGCYQALGVLHHLWRREQLSFQDFINSPKINGYRGLHTTIIKKDGTRLRCKIMSKEMREYAHKGVSTMCFDNEALGLLDYIPWTERIAPLAKDTEERSEEFWNILQNDILGKSIIVHSSDDRAVMLPEGSTALDGAFYCYGKRALCTKKIIVDGVEKALCDPLENGVSLAIEMSKRKKVNRDWLKWANSGLATAHIRSELSTKSKGKRVELGKQLLQRVLDQQHKGFLEEFDQKSLDSEAKAIGYKNLDESYIAIADGHLKPITLFEAIFRKKSDVLNKQMCVIRFSMDIKDIDLIQSMINIYKQYGISMKNIQFKVFTHFLGNTRIKIALTNEEQRSIVQDLKNAGVENVRLETIHGRINILFMFLAMVILWGLDPVAAKELLKTSITPYDLTFIRFIMFFAATGAIYLFQSIVSQQKFKPLSFHQPSLILAGVTLFVTAISTYFALSYISPTQYILFILAGTTIPSFVSSTFRKKSNLAMPFVALMALLLVILAIMYVQGTSFIGSIFAAISAIGFAFYSIFSKYYQMQKERVQARYAAFLFWLSIIGLTLAFIVFPFTNLTLLSLRLITIAAGFVLLFTIIPYAFYYALLLRKDISKLGEALLFTAIPTIVAESILTQSVFPLIAAPILLVLFWQQMQENRHAN